MLLTHVTQQQKEGNTYVPSFMNGSKCLPAGVLANMAC